MDWHAALGIFAGGLQVYSIIPYIKDMLHGTTRPNIVSWSIWTLLEVIAIGAQFTSGASWSVLLLIATAFNTGLVVVLALRGYGYKKYGFLDYFCLGLALVAIGMWFVFSSPALAIGLILIADLSAGMPTLVKSYKDPSSEQLFSWFLIVVASSLALVSSQILDFSNLAYPLYLALYNGLVCILILIGRRQLKNA